MSKGKLTIGMTQFTCVSDTEANIKKAEEQIRALAAKGAKAICTQELFNSLYFAQIHDRNECLRAEPVDGPTNKRMQSLAKELDVVIVSCFFEYAIDGVYYNSAAVIDANGKILGVYRKHHIPDSPHYNEKYYFTPGDSPYTVWKTKYGKFGVLICWDQWFPEPTRILALKGADFIFYPSAIGTDPDNQEDVSQTWVDAIRGHGIHNTFYVCVCNRTGREDATDGSGYLDFYGRGFVSDPWGNMVTEGAMYKEDLIVAELDLDEVRRARDILRLLRDRRVDSYQEILKPSISE
ncbi:MAG: carbon-nitrogen hydrolase [Clostridiales bacterium]|nr:carbon-nitrogen hydrolase [Clostridiales bacterium]